MMFFRNKVPREVTNITYKTSYSGSKDSALDLEISGLTLKQVQRIYDALNNEYNYDLDLANIKIIFSGPKTICIDKTTGQKTMITYSKEDSIYMTRSNLISLVLIKYILYKQNRKKEYTKFCSKLSCGTDAYIYLQGLIGIDNVEKILDRFLQQDGIESA